MGCSLTFSVPPPEITLNSGELPNFGSREQRWLSQSDNYNFESRVILSDDGGISHITMRRGENKIIAVDHLVVSVDDGLIAASLLVVPDPDLIQGSRRAGSPAQLKC